MGEWAIWQVAMELLEEESCLEDVVSCMEPNPQEEWELVTKQNPWTGELVQLRIPHVEAER